jgi:hypothetical protein
MCRRMELQAPVLPELQAPSEAPIVMSSRATFQAFWTQPAPTDDDEVEARSARPWAVVVPMVAVTAAFAAVMAWVG